MQEKAGAPLTAADAAPSRRADAAGAATQHRRARNARVLLAVAALTFAADLASKQWVLATLVPGRRIDLLGSWLGLQLIGNPGAALSLGSGATWVFTVLAVVIVAWLVRASGRVDHRGWAVALGLLLGGAVGNLLDRLVRAPGPGRGHVVDFIDYGVFIGNVADIAIVVAAGALALLSFRGIPMTTPEPTAKDPA